MKLSGTDCPKRNSPGVLRHRSAALKVPDTQELVAVDLGHRARQQLAIGGNIEIVRNDAIGKQVHPVPGVIGRWYAYDGRDAVLVANAYQ